MNRHKVAVISPGSFVIPSGRSSSVERVIEKIAPLAPQEFDIRVFGRIDKDYPAKGMLGRVPCFRVPGGAAYLPSILRHLRVWRPDTVDVHNRPILACRLKRRMPQARVLLTLHSTSFIQPENLPTTHAGSILNALDGIVVNSSFLKEELVRRFPGLQCSVDVNHLGVSLEDFVPRWTPMGEALRRARLADMGWQNRKIILYMGRLIEAKGVHHLLEALPTIVPKVKEALLVIVGSAYYGRGKETAYVHHLKEIASVYPEHVAFLPFTPYPAVADWYNLADVVVVPSKGDEAFGLVNVEAMASGVPVVAANVGGIPEIVEGGSSGLLLSPSELGTKLGDSLVTLLQDEEIRRRMGLAGREAARLKFRWQLTAERWVNLMGHPSPYVTG